MKLISFKAGENWANDQKMEFTVEHKGEQKTFILKEKADWPIIHGEPVEKVEPWLMKRYGSLCFLAFGILA